jgi:hypothetical protein
MISKAPGGLISIKVLIPGMTLWKKNLVQPLFGAAVSTILIGQEGDKSKPLRLRRSFTAMGTSHSF